MVGKEYECRDCGRAFRVDEEQKKPPKCPGCESADVAPKESGPLPPWIQALENKRNSSCN